MSNNFADNDNDKNTPDRYYDLGDSTDLRPDTRTELLTFPGVQNLFHQSALMIICGMLNNSGKSTIYYGISRSGIVGGIEMNRATRDDIRLEWDKKGVTEFKPSLIHSNIEILFVPVWGKYSGGGLCGSGWLENVCVLEVRVKPSSNVLYSVRREGTYARVGAETVEMSAGDVYELGCRSAMGAHKREVEALVAELRRLAGSRSLEDVMRDGGV